MSSQTSERGPSRPTTPARPLSSASNNGIGSPDGSVAASRRRTKSPSWSLSSQFGDEQNESTLEKVVRSWEEAQNSCKLIMEWDDPEYMDEYMEFLRDREAMAREMLAKVACASLKWGGKVERAKEIVMAQLPVDLAEQIDGLEMAGYTNVKDRFCRVYAHVGTIDGKLDAAGLAKVLRGYSNNPKAKGLLEEEALARRLTMLSRRSLSKTLSRRIPGERMLESEKLLCVCEMKQGSVGLLEGIFLTMAALRLAIDWHEIPNTQDGKERKKAHQDKLFEFQWRRELEHVAVDLQKSEEAKRRRTWRFEFDRLVTRRNKVLRLFKKFGCIVLLDPLWSPLVTRTSNFNALQDCVMENVLTRERYQEDIVEGGGDVPWHTGNELDNERMLIELVRYFTTDAIAKFVGDTVKQLEEDVTTMMP